MPHQQRCTLVEGEVAELASNIQLNGCSGFVVAPFAVSAECPILLIQPDKVELLPDDDTHPEDTVIADTPTTPRPSSSYAADFNMFHGALFSNRFQKLVLSRCATEPNDGHAAPIDLFKRACRLYPRLFVALVSTPQSGVWLTATPEILLEGDGHKWHTIALAGTMRLRPDEMDGEGQHLRWSPKNIEEQRHVASYIADVLRRFSDDVHEEGPRTVRAANLVHLRSDFTFTINNIICTRAGDLLEALHPTPAVCGLPKREAMEFILRNESTDRRYYSGFMGPLCLSMEKHGEQWLSTEKHGERWLTSLYVSLRCMNILPNIFRLYAGGGILRESTMKKEWEETENKMATMRQTIHTVNDRTSPRTPPR